MGIFLKSSLGRTLRKIRVGKQVSLSSLADDSLSKSQISRFERGESEISCIRLIHLLNKLNISLDEFLIAHNNEHEDTLNFMTLMNDIRNKYTLKEFDKLKELLLDSSPYPIHPLESTMIKSIIYTIDPSIKPNDTELLDLMNYLFKIEIWGYYEIILLGNCVRTIEYSSLFLLTKEMLANYIYSTSNKTNKRLVSQLAINCLISSIDSTHFDHCDYLINEISILLENELNYYEQTVFLYTRGYFEYKKNDDTGKLKMQQAIQIFDFLDEQAMKNYYTEHYSTHVH